MKTILVVDDEFGIAEALSSTLSDEGYRVFTAPNGKQGLEMLAEVKPDAIVLDYMMPIMNGAQMLLAIQADPAYRSIPVIMISSVGEPSVKRICDGYVGFLRKPFELE